MNALEKYFLENNIITNKQAEEIGVKRHILASLVQKGKLERVKKGVYKKKDAVDDDFAGFEVYYQPIVDTKTYRLIGAEALMRFFMPDPDGGSPQFISPVEFIPLLEESGLIIPVGKWILEQSARQCAIWTKQIESFRINVKVMC